MASTTPPQTTGKRNRTASRTSSASTSPSSTSISSPETKILRSSTTPDHSEGDQGQRPILCTLPPTCNRQPTTLENSKELERHYATYHAHVCEYAGCGCVFPEARLLELHQTECHDPLAAVRKERGEKIFGCLLQTCPRFFQTPKARRLHMIEGHKYPKEFFFAVTNKGIGGLLKKWGEGASMIRGEWKAREKEVTKNGKGKVEEDENGARMVVEANSDEDEENSSEEMDMDELERTPKPHNRPLHVESPPRAIGTSPGQNADVDSLVDGFTSLSLVPPSIRFGRGGRGGALGMRGRGRATIGTYHQRSTSIESERGTRGRGKGHSGSGSIGSRGEMGGDVVLIGRGRGGRGRRHNN